MIMIVMPAMHGNQNSTINNDIKIIIKYYIEGSNDNNNDNDDNRNNNNANDNNNTVIIMIIIVKVPSIMTQLIIF